MLVRLTSVMLICRSRSRSPTKRSRRRRSRTRSSSERSSRSPDEGRRHRGRDTHRHRAGSSRLGRCYQLICIQSSKCNIIVMCPWQRLTCASTFPAVGLGPRQASLTEEVVALQCGLHSLMCTLRNSFSSGGSANVMNGSVLSRPFGCAGEVTGIHH